MLKILQSVAPLVFALALGAQQARAQSDFTVPAGDVAELISAINAANADATGPRTIRLTRSTYTLTAVDNTTGRGPNGLPQLTQSMTIEGNGATLERTGGASFRFLQVSGGVATLRDLTLRGGNATQGGALLVEDAAVVIERCTFNGNGSPGSFGGALQGSSSAVVVVNCTFEGNTAGVGGAIAIDTGSTLTASNCTIVRNTATTPFYGFGGGIQGAVILTNTIVALNRAPNGPDIYGTATLTNCFVGDTTPGLTVTDGGGNVLDGGDPIVGPLQDNGGLTPTCALLSGSAAIDAGSATGAPATDQRGAGFPRVIGAEIDMGAYEHSPAPIVARVTAPDVTATASTYQFTVRYVSDLSGVGGGIDVTTLDGADVTVTGPSGFSANASLVSVDDPLNGTPRVATYEINAPLGGWQDSHNGTYTISLLAGAVQDTAAAAVVDGPIGTFDVLIDTVPPTAVATAPDVTSPGGQTYTFTVTYTDAFSVDVSTIGDGDVVVNPGALVATFVSVNTPGDGSPRVATYTITPPGNAWDEADSDTYTIELQATQVTDTSGNAAVAGDIGTFSVAIDETAPSAVGSAPAVTTAGAATHTITVTYTDAFAVDVTTIGDGDVVVNPGALVATFVSVDDPADGTPRVATYTITPPGGTWDAADDGTYTIALQAGEVTDTSGNAAAAGNVGTFTVAIDVAVPTAVAAAADVTAFGGTTHTIVVAYTDDLAIDVSTLDDDDVIVNPGALPATFVDVDVNTDGAAREATYRITAPGGTWDAADNRTYTIALRTGEVTDTSGKAVAAGSVGTFTVSVTDPQRRHRHGGCSMTARSTSSWSSPWSALALGLLAVLTVGARRRRPQ